MLARSIGVSYDRPCLWASGGTLSGKVHSVLNGRVDGAPHMMFNVALILAKKYCHGLRLEMISPIFRTLSKVSRQDLS